MNLLVLRPDEIRANHAVLADRRSQHVLGLLGKRAGDTVRAGVLGEGVCEAVISEADLAASRVHLELGARKPQSIPRTSLILALPRPKALSRIVQLAASFGIQRLDLVGARKVDPAYFSSPRLHPDRLLEDALLGLEQGGLVHLPTFGIHRALGSFLRGLTPQGGQARVLFDPGAPTHLAGLLLGSTAEERAPARETTLAFGPDGGFLREELELFAAARFESALLTAPTLRTEVAVAAGLGQLALVRQLGFR